MISLKKMIAIALGIGLLIGSTSGAIGAWHLRSVAADRDMAKAEAAALTLRHTFDVAVIAAQEDARTEERKRQDAANKIAGEARKDVQQINETAAVVDGVTGGLQHAASVYASSASCDPGVARRGEAATRAAMVLSDLFGQCTAAATRLAKSADLSRVAGTACEKFGDALTGQPSSQ